MQEQPRKDNGESIFLLVNGEQNFEKQRKPRSLLCCALITSLVWFLVFVVIGGSTTLAGWLYFDGQCHNRQTAVYNYTSTDADKVTLFLMEGDVEISTGDYEQVLIQVTQLFPDALTYPYRPAFTTNDRETVFVDSPLKSYIAVSICTSQSIKVQIPSWLVESVSIYTSTGVTLSGSGLDSVSVVSVGSEAWTNIHMSNFSARSIDISADFIFGSLIADGDNSTIFLNATNSVNVKVAGFSGAFEEISENCNVYSSNNETLSLVINDPGLIVGSFGANSDANSTSLLTVTSGYWAEIEFLDQ